MTIPPLRAYVLNQERRSGMGKRRCSESLQQFVRTLQALHHGALVIVSCFSSNCPDKDFNGLVQSEEGVEVIFEARQSFPHFFLVEES